MMSLIESKSRLQAWRQDLTKPPLYPIIGLFKVNFKSKPTPFTLVLVHGLKDLRGHHKFNISSPPLNETVLSRWDLRRNKRLKPVDYDFRHKFIDRIAEANRPKLFDCLRRSLFWNETNERLIKRFRNLTPQEPALYGFASIRANNIPRFLKENHLRISIRVRGFEGLHVKKGTSDFLRRRKEYNAS